MLDSRHTALLDGIVRSGSEKLWKRWYVTVSGSATRTRITDGAGVMDSYTPTVCDPTQVCCEGVGPSWSVRAL